MRSKDGEGSARLRQAEAFPQCRAFAESGVPMITPSVIACGDATFPKGTAFSGSDKVSGST